MENEQMLSAVTQMLEEQKRYMVQQERINIALQSINAHMSEMESALKNIKALSPDLGTEKLQQDVAQIKKLLYEIPKGAVHQKRYLLFPEYNAKDYYGAVLKWFLYMLVATYAYWLMKFWIVGK
jgi:hypothetical protein